VNVRINGQDRDVPAGATVASLLEDLGLGSERVAVERNGAIVPKTEYETTPLTEGDRLEIVQFVGGG
jgi:thiamine biosynthesis protein ThiS